MELETLNQHAFQLFVFCFHNETGEPAYDKCDDLTRLLTINICFQLNSTANILYFYDK